jgi:hypothetical protein
VRLGYPEAVEGRVVTLGGPAVWELVGELWLAAVVALHGVLLLFAAVVANNAQYYLVLDTAHFHRTGTTNCPGGQTALYPKPHARLMDTEEGPVGTYSLNSIICILNVKID